MGPAAGPGGELDLKSAAMGALESMARQLKGRAREGAITDDRIGNAKKRGRIGGP